MTAGGAQPKGTLPKGTESSGTGTSPGAEPPRRLSLGDPLDGRAAEDRPEAWGEHSENESDRLVRYRAETPPHHGG